MAYREDKDLEFLSGIDSKDLDDLVYCLTHDKDGKSRWCRGRGIGSLDLE